MNTTDGNTTDGNTTDGNTTDGNTTDGNTTDGNTTDGAAPLLSIALRDGSTLSIAPDAVRVSAAPNVQATAEATAEEGGGAETIAEAIAETIAETIALDRVQDARQIVPEPPTFALRVAGRRLLEFQPLDPADGALMLEAIYRLRPDLRPAGFERPAHVPAWWPGAPGAAWPAPGAPAWASSDSSGPRPAYGPEFGAGGLPAYGSRPRVVPPYPIVPPVSAPGAASPGSPAASVPRDLLGLVGAAFRLFRAHWRAWLLLGLIVSAPPAILSGAVQMATYTVRGFNSWRGLDVGAIGIWPAHPPRPQQVVALVALVVAGILIGFVSFAWHAAVIGPAGEQAQLGSPVDVRGSVERGVRRFVPVLLVTLSAFAVPLVAMSIPLGLAAAVASVIEGANPAATPDAALLAASSLVCLSAIAFLVLAVGGLYVMSRLFVAPYIAATQPLDVRSALLASWRLTGGRGRWWQAPGWRAVAAVLLVEIIEVVAVSPLSRFELASYALASLVVNPLAACVTGPLTSLAFVVALRDLRQRSGSAIPSHHQRLP